MGMDKMVLLLLCGLCVACKPKGTIKGEEASKKPKTVLDAKVVKVAFGSCNRTEAENFFWDDIVNYSPDVWIWGGDIVYADTDDMVKLHGMYQAQKQVTGYDSLLKQIYITGVWDDHDYGLNDGGAEFGAKAESQQEFLDFMGVAKDDPRRVQEGTYSSQLLSKPGGTVKIINLDTRYFRSALKQSKVKGRRYDPDTTSTKTILGKTQWKWLENELGESTSDFNIIITSVQFLSNAHGFEKWGNFPHEVEKMKKVIAKSGAKGVIFLSGDRHISEFSRANVEGVAYPIMDFTSSGLTHAYSSFTGEPNPYRVGQVVAKKSYGVLEINLETKEVMMKMMGDAGEVLQAVKQSY